MTKPIAFYPELARELGDIPSAIYYQQMYYWSDKGKRKDGFIYKTKEEIEQETTLTREQQDRIRKKLVDKGWIETKLIKANGAPTLHYKCLVNVGVNIGKPTNGLVGNTLIPEKCETHYSITENTTENTHNSVCEEKEKKTIRAKDIKAKDIIDGLKDKNGQPLEVTTAGDYIPDYFSPKQKLAIKKRLERSLGLGRSNRWTQLLFGSACDFIYAYEKYFGYKYCGNVLVEEIARNLATWYENGETRETIRDMIEKFFFSEKASKVTITPNSLFSQHTYNSWKQNKLKPPKSKF